MRLSRKSLWDFLFCERLLSKLDNSERFFFFKISSKSSFPCVCFGIGTYIPHLEGIIQTIVRNSLTQYQAYASPSQTILDRLEQFKLCRLV